MANTVFRLIAPVLLGAFILLFPADGLRALGLGEARVDSWLGQRLDVSIRLLAAEDENVESLTVRPAELADFERLGVPSEALALGLEVSIDRSVEPPRIRVRSRQPVNDPVVQVLIDARWENGRVLREYTLFLDPPVVDSPPPARRAEAPAAERDRDAAEQAPREDRPATATRQPTPAQGSRQPDAASQADQTAQPSGGEVVDVSPGDTLWSIASDWRSDASLSMDQVMLAIFNRNRKAFLGENINRLRGDARLTMPEPSEARAVSRQEAERRVREHMNAWQPAAASDAPVLSEAGMPDAGSESDRQDEADPSDQEESGADAAEETASESSDAVTETQEAAAEESDATHRLDVRPLDEEQGSEGAAVSDEEIRRVRGELIEAEDRILAEGLEREEFDDRVGEIRDALNQRDLAGLAVAEESLAELQERLREVREEEAEAAADGSSEDEGADGEGESRRAVADYMRRLEGDDGQVDEAVDAAAADGADEEDRADGQTDAQAEDTQAGDAESAAPEQDDEQDSESNRGGVPGWLWLAGGVALLGLILAAVALKLRGRRGNDADAGAGQADGGDSLESARADVAHNPTDLAAHLALLHQLADAGREQEFTDAFDRMYQQVDDESDEHWQEALSLASAHAPEHPLLTPQETALDDDDYERRADEMMGMLEADSKQDDEDTLEDESLSMDEDDEPEAPRTEAGTDEQDQDEALGDDMDLAVLADRVDDPSLEPGQDRSFDAPGEDLDFDVFDEDEGADGTEASAEAERDETPVELPDEADAGSDLDLGPAREQEADEVFGEAGARDEEDLDLEFSSDVADESELAESEGLAFELDEEPDGFSAEDADEDGAEGAEEIAGEAEEGAEAALSDEDADVKLDLARAYISVDLADSARSVLEEVISDGSAEKRAEARKLLDDLD